MHVNNHWSFYSSFKTYSMLFTLFKEFSKFFDILSFQRFSFPSTFLLSIIGKTFCDLVGFPYTIKFALPMLTVYLFFYLINRFWIIKTDLFFITMCRNSVSGYLILCSLSIIIYNPKPASLSVIYMSLIIICTFLSVFWQISQQRVSSANLRFVTFRLPIITHHCYPCPSYNPGSITVQMDQWYTADLLWYTVFFVGNSSNLSTCRILVIFVSDKLVISIDPLLICIRKIW